MNVVAQLTQFVGRDVINKNTTDLAVRCSTGSVELSCVAINTPLVAGPPTGRDDAIQRDKRYRHGPLLLRRTRCFFPSGGLSHSQYSLLPTHGRMAQAKSVWVPGSVPRWFTCPMTVA